MNKIFFAVLILAVFLTAKPALAKTNDSLWAAIIKFAQEIIPGGEGAMSQPMEEEKFDEDFVDPRELQQVLREIKDLKKELNRLAKQAGKTAGREATLADVNALLGQVSGFESNINSGTNVQEAIQEFREAEIWQDLNKIRAKIEIPKQKSQWEKEIKKLEKILNQKKFQNLGLELSGVKTKLEENRAGLAKIQEFYNAGEFEEAMEEFNSLREDFNPVDVGNILQRTQELTNRLKTIKNAEVRNKVKEIYQEVIDNFNQGEYRVAWELMNESWQDIMNLVSKASSVGKKQGYSKEGFLQMSNKLEQQVKGKAEEKRAIIQERREEKQEVKEKIEPAPLAPQPTQ